ncbi:Hypothetical protein, putative [Bodo saltans]|uniref:Uncharacterized protein n=1 Tax=Bodo saltans TaxID=75058 RepID=A0A0S4JEL6_BODSA|nr:Hypothetical protein, putative [Bodo saltans]|eukprot:CUG88417.1 Hypothetical protein, putative [Bodo saltans]
MSDKKKNLHDASKEELIAIVKQLHNRQQQLTSAAVKPSIVTTAPSSTTAGSTSMEQQAKQELEARIGSLLEQSKLLKLEVSQLERGKTALEAQVRRLEEKSATDEDTIQVLIRQLEEGAGGTSAGGAATEVPPASITTSPGGAAGGGNGRNSSASAAAANAPTSSSGVVGANNNNTSIPFAAVEELKETIRALESALEQAQDKVCDLTAYNQFWEVQERTRASSSSSAHVSSTAGGEAISVSTEQPNTSTTIATITRRQEEQEEVNEELKQLRETNRRLRIDGELNANACERYQREAQELLHLCALLQRSSTPLGQHLHHHHQHHDDVIIDGVLSPKPKLTSSASTANLGLNTRVPREEDHEDQDDTYQKSPQKPQHPTTTYDGSSTTSTRSLLPQQQASVLVYHGSSSSNRMSQQQQQQQQQQQRSSEGFDDDQLHNNNSGNNSVHSGSAHRSSNGVYTSAAIAGGGQQHQPQQQGPQHQHNSAHRQLSRTGSYADDVSSSHRSHHHLQSNSHSFGDDGSARGGGHSAAVVKKSGPAFLATLPDIQLRGATPREKKLLERLKLLEDHIRTSDTIDATRQRQVEEADQMRGELMAGMRQQIASLKSESSKLRADLLLQQQHQQPYAAAPPLPEQPKTLVERQEPSTSRANHDDQPPSSLVALLPHNLRSESTQTEELDDALREQQPQQSQPIVETTSALEAVPQLEAYVGAVSAYVSSSSSAPSTPTRPNGNESPLKGTNDDDQGSSKPAEKGDTQTGDEEGSDAFIAELLEKNAELIETITSLEAQLSAAAARAADREERFTNAVSAVRGIKQRAAETAAQVESLTSELEQQKALTALAESTLVSFQAVQRGVSENYRSAELAMYRTAWESADHLALEVYRLFAAPHLSTTEVVVTSEIAVTKLSSSSSQSKSIVDDLKWLDENVWPAVACEPAAPPSRNAVDEHHSVGVGASSTTSALVANERSSTLVFSDDGGGGSGTTPLTPWHHQGEHPQQLQHFRQPSAQAPPLQDDAFGTASMTTQIHPHHAHQLAATGNEKGIGTAAASATAAPPVESSSTSFFSDWVSDFTSTSNSNNYNNRIQHHTNTTHHQVPPAQFTPSSTVEFDPFA